MNRWKYRCLWVKNWVERWLGLENKRLASFEQQCKMQEYFEERYMEFQEYSSVDLRRLQNECDDEVDILIMEIVLADRDWRC